MTDLERVELVLRRVGMRWQNAPNDVGVKIGCALIQVAEGVKEILDDQTKSNIEDAM